MLRVSLRGLLARKLRLTLTAVSVALGVTLIAGTYVFTDTINTTFDRIFSESYSGVDAAVTPKEAIADQDDFYDSPPVPDALLAKVRRQPSVAIAEGTVFDDGGTILDKDGERIGAGGAPNFIASYTATEQFQQFRVVEGKPPGGPGEVVLDKSTADRLGFEIGDRLAVQGEAPRKDYAIVGIAKLGSVDSFGGAAVALLTLDEARRATAKKGFDEIDVVAKEGVSPEALVSALEQVVGDEATVRTGAQEADEQTSQIKEDLSFLQIALLAFAGISLFVGAFIIFNTFSITVAQRTREFGLLRTLGATRRQVLGSVLAEGALLGVVGSVAGLGLGILTAAGLKAMFKAFGIDLPSQGTVVESRTIVVSLVVGTVVTLLASMAPALRSTRVPPMAALREGTSTESRHRSRVLTPLSFGLTGLGIALMVVGLFFVDDEGGALGALGGGAAATFLGVALLSPRLVKPMAGLLGRPVVRAGGMAGRLARENSMRQPGRTAVTAAALMVGVALVAFASIFAAGAKEYIASAVDTGSKAQLVVQNTDGFSPFSSQATEAVRRTPGVEGVASVRFTQAAYDGEKEDIAGVDTTSFGSLFTVDWEEGSDAVWSRLGLGGVVLQKDKAEELGVGVGDPVTLVTTSGRAVALRVAGLHDDQSPVLADFVVSNALLEREWQEDKDSFVLVATGAGPDPKPAIDRLLERDFPQAEALTNEEFKDDQAGQVDQLLMLIYALLALSIIVSLFGIVNTLVLSITERTRELGLLRAVGGSRRFVKRVIRYEAVIVALIGSVLGLALGVALATLVTRAIDEFTLVVPYATLVVVLIAGAIAGLLAAILPARRAARLDVLQALAYE